MLNQIVQLFLYLINGAYVNQSSMQSMYILKWHL